MTLVRAVRSAGVRVVLTVRRVIAHAGPSLAELGVRLRQARVDAGLTQDDLAAAVGLHRKTVSRVELGQHAVSVVGLIAMARALGVSAGRLLD